MDRLEEIEERWAKTTRGPWWPDVGNLTCVGAGTGPTEYIAMTNARDRDAIAAAPQDIAHLIAEVKRLRRELALYLEGE